MTDNIVMQGVLSVRIKDLTPHPLNARRGNVDLIAESLATHGQYRPVVINQDNTILAGHHVVQAAKRLGWSHIGVVQIRTSDAQAKRILLADNRTADLASYNETVLLELLEAMPDLTGTGFGPADIAALDAIIGGDEPLGIQEGAPPSEPDPLSPTVVLQVGPLFGAEWDRNNYEQWRDREFPETKRPRIIGTLKDMLGIPTPIPPSKQPPTIPADIETVPLSYLQTHPHNPREGDIGAITESLEVNGQYRPVVVNKVTGHVVAGNHTYLAAKQLGWDRIAVQWIAVDEDTENRIVLIDNRTSDLATYDTNSLKDLLAQTRGYEGTGYSKEEAAAILAGTEPAKPGPKPTGQTAIKIGEYGWRMPTDLYDTWADGLDLDIICSRLRIDGTALH